MLTLKSFAEFAEVDNDTILLNAFGDIDLSREALQADVCSGLSWTESGATKWA